ncbi:c-type cytochrome [Paracoccus sp. S-4012]|uniref:c-type cytochrome n=1 Tax=Paracoccus sp. S-4012 TaxID=2665648 RepID=UPI0012B09176|nr:c-type cytochrome [Paracoccus sp. S-4012]MRX52257.1 c-type cytochrome [Paracoccus sp. S-4012]
MRGRRHIGTGTRAPHRGRIMLAVAAVGIWAAPPAHPQAVGIPSGQAIAGRPQSTAPLAVTPATTQQALTERAGQAEGAAPPQAAPAPAPVVAQPPGTLFPRPQGPPVTTPGLQASATPQPARTGPVPTNLCVGCHSPPQGPPLSGLRSGTWLAPNITPDPVSGVGAWSRDDLFAYLRHGRAPGRAQAGGPMAPLVEMLQAYSDDDIRDLVDWMAAQPPHRDPADDAPASERGGPVPFDSAALQFTALGAQASLEGLGQALYNGSCASCHGIDGAGTPDGYFPSMFHNSAVGRSPPVNLVAAMLDGVRRQIGDEIVMMPSFDGQRRVPGGLSDADLAMVASFVARQWGDPDSAPITEEEIARARTGWWGEGEPPSSARGELIAVGGGPGGIASVCFDCHGMQGQGDDASGTPRIAGMDPAYFAKQMRDYAAGTRPNGAMTPIARQLDEQDWHALALYYAAQVPADATAIARPDPALVAAGEALHLHGTPQRGVQACADCHGADGRGFGTVFPALLNQPGIYTAGQLRLWREGVRRNDPHDLMGAASRPLTDDDIAALAAYLAGLAP